MLIHEMHWECVTGAAVLLLGGDSGGREGGGGDGGGGEVAVYCRVACPAAALTGSAPGAAACLGAL
jgi:hypothetical protein